MDQKIIILTVIVLIAATCISLQAKSQSKKSNKAQTNPYLELRSQVFSMTPKDLHIQTSDNKEVAFGAILEMEISGGVVTIISFSTGDASMYTSTGGGMIGGISHQNVKDAAIAFVSTSQKYFQKMHIAKDFHTPKPGNMKFFILTNNNKYSVEATDAQITNEHSPWSELFYKANEVITQLRLIK